jgi:heptosyltransferase-2
MKRIIHTNCSHFNGYKPCPAHKSKDAVCADCNDYTPVGFRVLIIKIGAAGEVIRNTPLLYKLKALEKEMGANIEISWLTDFPDFVPASFTKRILKYNWQNIQILLEEEFDLLLSLDKEHHACALANKIAAKKKKGFLLDKRGRIIPADDSAKDKWLTGVYDDLMKESKKHYIEELFEVCGWQWDGEEYILEDYKDPGLSFQKTNDILVGLNTGAGNIWPTRIWPEELWDALITALMKEGYQVLLLGGPDEDSKNIRLAKSTGAHYEGLKSFKEFVGLADYCDIVVTAVTMALHIAIGLGKKIVLFNNIFNKNEFHLYGLGSIIEPEVPCKACYKGAFDSKCAVPNCMELITVENVFKTIVNTLDIKKTVRKNGKTKNKKIAETFYAS